MATIVILGAGIGGVPCAYELRKLLGREHRIVLVGKTPRFEFTPSNPWVAVGWRNTEETGVDLAPPLQKHGIDFEPQEAVAIDAAARHVTLANGSDLAWDYLVIAPAPGWPSRKYRASARRASPSPSAPTPTPRRPGLPTSASSKIQGRSSSAQPPAPAASGRPTSSP